MKKALQRAFPLTLPVAALHLWKRNTILSIAGGTAAHMILLRLL